MPRPKHRGVGNRRRGRRFRSASGAIIRSCGTNRVVVSGGCPQRCGSSPLPSVEIEWMRPVLGRPDRSRPIPRPPRRNSDSMSAAAATVEPEATHEEGHTISKTTSICPTCGNDTGIRIVYGLPGMGLVERAQSGEVALGGCLVMDDNPEWHCAGAGCGHEWQDSRSTPCVCFCTPAPDNLSISDTRLQDCPGERLPDDHRVRRCWSAPRRSCSVRHLEGRFAMP